MENTLTVEQVEIGTLDQLIEDAKNLTKSKRSLKSLIKKLTKSGKLNEISEHQKEYDKLEELHKLVNKRIEKLKKPVYHCSCGNEISALRMKKTKKCDACLLDYVLKTIKDNIKYRQEYRSNPDNECFIEDIYRSGANNLFDHCKGANFCICDIYHTSSTPNLIGIVWLEEHCGGRERLYRKLMDHIEFKLGNEILDTVNFLKLLKEYVFTCRIQKGFMNSDGKDCSTIVNFELIKYQKGDITWEQYNEVLERNGFYGIPERLKIRFDVFK
jgi:hypothetical protein